MHSRNRTHIAIITLVLLLAAGLRILALGKNAIWWDEGFSYWVFRQPLPDLIHQAALDTHPPTYYLLAHFWRVLAGDTALALRIPSMIDGLVTVALVYRAGRLVHSPAAGAAAALLAAIAPQWIAWSMEIRMYAQALAFAALALLAALKLMSPRTRHPWRWAALLALGEGGGLLSLFLVAGAIVVLNLGGLLAFITRRDRWPFALRWGAAQAAALAMFLPWYVYSSRAAAWQAAQPPIDFWFTLRLYISVFLVGIEENIDPLWPLITLAAVILAGAGVMAWRSLTERSEPRKSASPWRHEPILGTPPSPPQGARAEGVRDRTPALLLILGTLLPPLMMFGLFLLPRSERFNIAGPAGRHFLVLSVPIYLLLGWGIAAAARRWKPAWAALAVLAAMLGWSLATHFYPARGWVDDYASLGAALQSMARPGDAVLLDNDYEWPVFAYHYPGDYVPLPQERIRARGVARDMLRPVFTTHDGIWLVQTPFAAESDPDADIPAVLEARAVRVDHYPFPMGELVFYALTPERAALSAPAQAAAWPPDFRPAALTIAPGAALVGFTSPRQPVSAGTTIGVGLGWRVDAAAAGGAWPVALRLVGADGAEITSAALTLSSPAPGDYFQVTDLFIPTFGGSGPAHLELVAGPNSAGLGALRIEPTHSPIPESAEIPASAQKLDVRFGEHITLVAAELPGASTIHPGDVLPLTLYWRGDAPLSQRYKGFVHLLGEKVNPRLGSPLWGQDDHEPQTAPEAGFAPTTLWRPGSVIRDVYALRVLPATPAGQYRLEVGLYQPLDLTNLLVLGPDGSAAGGSYVLMVITVVR